MRQSRNRLRLSNNGGYNPCWSKDGKELYYVEGQTLMAVPIGIERESVFGSPLPLFEDPRLSLRGQSIPFVVSADRQRFLLKEPTGDAPPPEAVKRFQMRRLEEGEAPAEPF